MSRAGAGRLIRRPRYPPARRDRSGGAAPRAAAPAGAITPRFGLHARRAALGGVLVVALAAHLRLGLPLGACGRTLVPRQRERPQRPHRRSAIRLHSATVRLRSAPRNNDEGPAEAGPSRTSACRRRRYLMNSISEYFGSGHRSSATMRSRRSATSRTASIAGITLSRIHFACSRPSAAGW